ncbi:transposable element Tcb2 transposase [Trichonephila clavipes]|nr:transposable element Tcb2 transposase [Trichonephila clavipes]
MANNQSVRRHLDAFTRGRIIGKLEEGRRTAIRGFSSGRPRGTTPADDRYIVLQARRNRLQTAGEIARHTTQVTGRPISRFTVARRLHGGGLFARRPVRCVPLMPAHRRRRSLWCREHWNWIDNEWGRVIFTDESRFSLSSDSHRILIWRERGSRNHSSNIIERDRLSKTAYTNHENKLMLVNSEVSELSMQKAASELLVLHPTKNTIVECGISVDGTWQHRETLKGSVKNMKIVPSSNRSLNCSQ